jgi:hypothetical protein
MIIYFIPLIVDTLDDRNSRLRSALTHMVIAPKRDLPAGPENNTMRVAYWLASA